MTKTETQETAGTQQQQPSPDTDKALKDLEQRAPDAAPGAADQSGGPGTETGDPTPEAEYIPKGPPLPEGFDRDRPWGVWVKLGDGMVQRVVNNWDFVTPTTIEGEKVDGHSLMLWGSESFLTRVMPNGIIDIEKYPLVVALIGLGLICLQNLETWVDSKGVEHWRLRPMRKAIAKAGPDGKGATVQVGGGDVATGGKA